MFTALPHSSSFLPPFKVTPPTIVITTLYFLFFFSLFLSLCLFLTFLFLLSLALLSRAWLEEPPKHTHRNNSVHFIKSVLNLAAFTTYLPIYLPISQTLPTSENHTLSENPNDDFAIFCNISLFKLCHLTLSLFDLIRLIR